MYSKTVLASLKINILLGMNFQKGNHSLIYCRQMVNKFPQPDLLFLSCSYWPYCPYFTSQNYTVRNKQGRSLLV